MILINKARLPHNLIKTFPLGTIAEAGLRATFKIVHPILDYSFSAIFIHHHHSFQWLLVAFKHLVEDYLAQKRSQRQRKFEDQRDHAVWLTSCWVGIVKLCQKDYVNVIEY